MASVLWYSDSQEVAGTWRSALHASMGVQIEESRLCYGLRLKGGQEGDLRILSDNTLRRSHPDVILLQLGCNDDADAETGTMQAYSKVLFDYPYGTVCTLTGKMSRQKTIAVSKDEARIATDNFAGALYRIVMHLRTTLPDARIFLLSPLAIGGQHTEADKAKLKQLKLVANMFCLPMISDNADVMKSYAFLWNKNRPTLGNVLLIGDSYCEQRRWTAQLEAIADVNLVNLGVSSATVKDRNDGKQASYTAYPVKTDNTGNHNTLASQIQKLRRLMSGRNLGKDETAIPAGYRPDYILIEGGANDNPDSEADVRGYEADIRLDRRTTFAGALSYLVGEVRKMFPDAKVYIVTPGGLYYGHTDKPFDYIVKANQMRTAASILHVPTVNWDMNGRLSFVFNNSRGTGTGSAASPYRYNISTRETVDLLHPNDLGGLYLAESVVRTLK